MVNNHMVCSGAGGNPVYFPSALFLVTCFPGSYLDVLNDDIMRSYADAPLNEGDSGIGSGLPGNGDIGIYYLKAASFQIDYSGNFKYNNTGTLKLQRF
jgi:hypothetical protein